MSPISAPDRVPSSSYDDGGVSISVSDRSASDNRVGAFFDSDFAAVSPIYFHSLGNRKYFGIFSQRWHSATYTADNPNLFSDYTVDTVPSWAIFDGESGHHIPIPSHNGNNITTKINSDGRVAVAACSRSTIYLYVLQSCSFGDSISGVVSHYHLNPVTGQVTLHGEDIIPNIVVNDETVIFDRGIRCDKSHLTFVGRGESSGELYLARKHWGYVGRDVPYEYQSNRGWFSDSSKAFCLYDNDGSPLVTAGPVSVIDYQNKTWMSVVQDDAGDKYAQVYCSAGLQDGWAPQGQSYFLGTVDTYLGGTAYFQGMLRPNRLRVGETSITGVPLVYATLVESGDDSGISITWDLWPVYVPGSTRTVTSAASLNVGLDPYAIGS